MDTNLNLDNDTGILFVGHGSRLPYNKEVVTEVAEKYAEDHPEHPIEVGFMELTQPDIPTAFNKLKNREVKRVIVVPVFLAHGKHTKHDIPMILGLEPQDLDILEKSLAQDGKEHGHHHHHHEEPKKVDFDGEIIYTEPLGADDYIVDIVARRLDDYL